LRVGGRGGWLGGERERGGALSPCFPQPSPAHIPSLPNGGCAFPLCCRWMSFVDAGQGVAKALPPRAAAAVAPQSAWAHLQPPADPPHGPSTVAATGLPPGAGYPLLPRPLYLPHPNYLALWLMDGLGRQVPPLSPPPPRRPSPPPPPPPTRRPGTPTAVALRPPPPASAGEVCLQFPLPTTSGTWTRS
jgi:hypothetical protein